MITDYGGWPMDWMLHPQSENLLAISLEELREYERCVEHLWEATSDTNEQGIGCATSTTE